jgi:pyruvate dehydrogenase E2 component (dihydrolipoamide acetyltransferase)
MSQAITMPALSDTMSNGRLVKWAKKPGDRIKKGDLIAEVETDKAVMEVEAFQDGYLSGPLAAEGTEAPVGETIGYIADDVAGVASVKTTAVELPRPSTGNGDASSKSAARQAPASAVLAASLASLRPAPRHREAVAGKTPNDGHAASALDAGPPYRIERESSARAAVARGMIASAATPSFHLTALLPVAPLMTAARARNYSLSICFARACALTVIAHPLFNAAYTSEGLARRERVDIGIAVDHGDGLITPVLRDAAGRSLAELAEEWNTLRERAKIRRLSPSQYRGATFYVSDLGVFPVVRAFDSIIPVGASAILSIAAAGPHGAFVTLTCDHRVVFGADAARFLATLEQLLRDPSTLFAGVAQA